MGGMEAACTLPTTHAKRLGSVTLCWCVELHLGELKFLTSIVGAENCFPALDLTLPWRKKVSLEPHMGIRSCTMNLSSTTRVSATLSLSCTMN